MGIWVSPEGTEVPNQYQNRSFFRSQGVDGTVKLNRLNYSITEPFGLFYCVVPDASGINQILFANIGETVMTKIRVNSSYFHIIFYCSFC